MGCVSIGIMKDLLRDVSLEAYLEPRDNPFFSNLGLLSPEDTDFSPETLYIGNLSAALSVRARGGNFYGICIQDCEAPDSAREMLHGLIVIKESMRLETLFSIVERSFMRILSWQFSMQEAVISERSMSEFLTLSEPIIGNYIAVSDSAMMFVANTPGIECDCRICRELVEKGYHSEATVRHFIKNRHLDRWMHTDGLDVNERRDSKTKYPTVGRVFAFNNRYFEHVVMTCNRRPITQGLLDLFKMMTDVLLINVERDWKKKLDSTHIHDALLTDLLSGTQIERSRLEERARISGLCIKGRLLLLVFRPEDKDREMLWGRLSWELTMLLRGVKCLLFQNELVALADSSVLEKSSAGNRIRLQQLMEKSGAVCGISAVFQDLTQIQLAYQQALRVFSVHPANQDESLFTPTFPFEGDQERLLDFSDNAIAYLLRGNPDSAFYWYGSRYHDMLKKIYDYDVEHRTENLNLLHTYLVMERRATDVGNRLMTHRNNVIYHAGRISEMLDVSLEDPATRLHLLTAYMFLYVFGFKPSD